VPDRAAGRNRCEDGVSAHTRLKHDSAVTISRELLQRVVISIRLDGNGPPHDLTIR